ncbi:MAG: cation transporter [Deltaproteobacteria bacterium]|nr:cation transporter [Deltaproteobacteria bacterium]
MSAAQKGVLVNAALVVTKILGGIIGNSYALIADGIESGADVVSSLIVWRGLSISRREATDTYQFGYGRAETISGAIAAIMLLGAAIGVLIVAWREILTPHHLPHPMTLPLLAGVIIVKELLFRYVIDVSDETESSALKSDAWHHRSDALTSAAAFIGISIALLGGPGWESADDYAAIVCAFVIGATGIGMLRRSAAELMDRAPEASVLSQMRTAAESVPGVVLIEKLSARKSGLTYFVDMHVHADGAMSLHDAHILSGMVKTAVRAAVPAVQNVLIHMEPAEHS